ncbi:MAG: hypothetical protein JW942_06410 [Opitutales bacterium]|nr:hypothetical protein [Opitutales bacterium]
MAIRNLKLLSAIAIFTLIASATTIYSSTFLSIDVEQSLGLPPNDFGIESVSVGRIVFQNSDGEKDETSALYLLATVGVRNEPVIIESIEGHSPELKLLERGCSQPPLLLVYYHPGVNSYHLKAYAFDRFKLLPLGWQLPQSNLKWIQIDGNTIRIRHSVDSQKPLIIESTFDIVAERCLFVADRRIPVSENGG